MTENLRVQAAARSRPPAAAATPARSGPDQPLFGWWRPSARPDPHDARTASRPDPQAARIRRPPGSGQAVFLHTPEFPVLLTPSEPARRRRTRPRSRRGRAPASPASTPPRRRPTRSRRPGGTAPGTTVHAAPPDAPVPARRAHPASAWTRGNGQAGRRTGPRSAGRMVRRVRPRGRRPAQARSAGAVVDERLGYGGLTLWEAAGSRSRSPAVTRTVAGMVRVGPVYTPPELRGRGYAGAATAAVSQAALRRRRPRGGALHRPGQPHE